MQRLGYRPLSTPAFQDDDNGFVETSKLQMALYGGIQHSFFNVGETCAALLPHRRTSRGSPHTLRGSTRFPLMLQEQNRPPEIFSEGANK